MLHVVLSGLFFAAQNLASREYAHRYGRLTAALPLLCAASQAVVALIALLLGGGQTVPRDAFPLLLACGAAFIATYLLMVSAMAAGPLGLTALIVNASLAIPVLIARVCWGETVSAVRWAGIALVFLMLFLNVGKGADRRACSGRWVALSMGAFVCNGLLLVFQRLLTSGFPQVSAAGQTLWTALIAAGLSLLLLARACLRPGARARLAWVSPRALAWSALSGAGSALGNFYIFSALTAVSSLIAFPLRQGIVILLLWLAGMLLYREKQSPRAALMLLTGIAGIVLLNL